MKLLNSLPEYIMVGKTRLDIAIGKTPTQFRQQAKEQKLKYRTVFCLARNLRGKTDLHGHLYQPHEYVYMEQANTIN